MLLSELVSASREIAETRARSRKTELLASLLRRLEAPEIAAGVAYLSGGLPQGRIGLGGTAIEAAAASPARTRAADLTIAEVDGVLDRIRATSGPGSMAERARLLSSLFARATEAERDFLIRLVLGELRQGALLGVVEEALARAAALSASEIRRAAMLSGDLVAVAQAVLSEGRAGLERFRLQMFRPLQPMLAQSADDVDDALERLGEAVFEYKLDGARVQVHKSGDEVRVFSRQLNEVTGSVPELVEAARALPVGALIADGEAIALRPDGTPHPFQVTMRRFGRKLDVARMRDELPLTTFFFDLLHLDGADCFDAPAGERFRELGRVAPGLLLPSLVTGDAGLARAFFEEALTRGHEGLMAKSAAAPYEAGRRGFSWLKLKPAHTLDLVVLAAEWGHGRRSGWLSNIHLGARDPAAGGFVMLGKTFKGMTDEMLAWQTRRFQELAVATDSHVVHLRPEQVVEVAFSDVQESRQYPAGMALRFARVERYRDDKPAEQADTVETVRAILRGAAHRRGGRGE